MSTVGTKTCRKGRCRTRTPQRHGRIGVAWREQTDQTEALDHVEVYRLADAALYRAKGRGKDRVVMMDEVPLAADPFDRSSETPEPTRPRREISGGIGRGAPSLADLRRSRGLFSDAA